MVKREAVGDIRFSDSFPKNGGGEDVDFCLRIVERSQKWFASVPEARIVHPWWDKGSHQYRRFARWAYGDSTLPSLHPSYEFRNAPNLIETGFILLIISILFFLFLGISMRWIVGWVAGALVSEYAIDGIRMSSRERN